MAWATRWLSPDSIMVRPTPIRFSSSRAFFDSGRTLSATPITPRNRSRRFTTTVVQSQVPGPQRIAFQHGAQPFPMNGHTALRVSGIDSSLFGGFENRVGLQRNKPIQRSWPIETDDVPRSGNAPYHQVTSWIPHVADKFRGRIASDGNGGVLVVVDGIPLSIDALASILISHEGWSFEMAIIDSLE